MSQPIGAYSCQYCESDDPAVHACSECGNDLDLEDCMKGEGWCINCAIKD